MSMTSLQSKGGTYRTGKVSLEHLREHVAGFVRVSNIFKVLSRVTACNQPGSRSILTSTVDKDLVATGVLASVTSSNANPPRQGTE